MNKAQQQYAANRAYGSSQGKVPAYLEQEVMSWSKEKIILKMYDLFIISCKKKDNAKMSRVLVELMGALDFEYEETATRLYRLYEYCQRCVFQRKYDEALHIISELRDSWAEAFHLKK
jgi:flagellin-specific chaperone FliS